MSTGYTVWQSSDGLLKMMEFEPEYFKECVSTETKDRAKERGFAHFDEERWKIVLVLLTLFRGSEHLAQVILNRIEVETKCIRGDPTPHGHGVVSPVFVPLPYCIIVREQPWLQMFLDIALCEGNRELIFRRIEPIHGVIHPFSDVLENILPLAVGICFRTIELLRLIEISRNVHCWGVSEEFSRRQRGYILRDSRPYPGGIIGTDYSACFFLFKNFLAKQNPKKMRSKSILAISSSVLLLNS